MLVLSRKKLESIRIADDITIAVVEIRCDKVRLGINAPDDVPVHRAEVYEAILKTRTHRPATINDVGQNCEFSNDNVTWTEPHMLAAVSRSIEFDHTHYSDGIVYPFRYCRVPLAPIATLLNPVPLGRFLKRS